MPKYQIISQHDTKKHYFELMADNEQIIKTFFQFLIVGELVEIREIEYENNKTVSTNLNYNHSTTIKISSKDKKYFNSFRIPKTKKNLDEKEMESLILSHIKINNLKPEFIQISKIFK